MRDIRKSAVAAIAVENVRAASETLRAAGNGNVVVVAVACLARLGSAGEIEIHVVRDEQVEVAVAVIIQKTASCAPRITVPGNAGLFRHVGECAVAIVVIQDVVSPVSDEQIVVAIVVVVADAASLSPARTSQACFLCDVGERAVTIVVKQVAGGMAIRLSRRKACSIHQKNVEPAIVVVIEQGNTAAHFLQQELLVRHAAGNVLGAQQAGGSGYVGENNGKRCIGRPEIVKS